MNETAYAASGSAGETTPESDVPAARTPAVNDTPLTRAEIAQMIDERLGALRVYVLESDITAAQQAVKSLVELSSF